MAKLGRERSPACIVFSLRTGALVRDDEVRGPTLYFVKPDGSSAPLLTSIELATKLLAKGKIVFSRWPRTHCRMCGNWKSNCGAPGMKTYFSDAKDGVECPWHGKHVGWKR